jgi:hypothetical protein
MVKIIAKAMYAKIPHAFTAKTTLNIRLLRDSKKVVHIILSPYALERLLSSTGSAGGSGESELLVSSSHGAATGYHVPGVICLRIKLCEEMCLI